MSTHSDRVKHSFKCLFSWNVLTTGFNSRQNKTISFRLSHFPAAVDVHTSFGTEPASAASIDCTTELTPKRICCMKFDRRGCDDNFMILSTICLCSSAVLWLDRFCMDFSTAACWAFSISTSPLKLIDPNWLHHKHLISCCCSSSSSVLSLGQPEAIDSAGFTCLASFSCFFKDWQKVASLTNCCSFSASWRFSTETCSFFWCV